MQVVLLATRFRDARKVVWRYGGAQMQSIDGLAPHIGLKPWRRSTASRTSQRRTTIHLARSLKRSANNQPSILFLPTLLVSPPTTHRPPNAQSEEAAIPLSIPRHNSPPCHTHISHSQLHHHIVANQPIWVFRNSSDGWESDILRSLSSSQRIEFQSLTVFIST